MPEREEDKGTLAESRKRPKEPLSLRDERELGEECGLAAEGLALSRRCSTVVVARPGGRQKGSHRAYSKAGMLRPVIIPMYREIAVDIIKSNMKSAGMSRDRYFELLDICK